MPAHARDPIFVLDSHERFRPIAVESVERVPATIIGPDGAEGGEASLSALPPAGGRMNFPPDPEQQEKRLRGTLGGVGYRREVGGGGLTWVQYWLWYLYNPKIVFVTGNHEGDWEFVQVGYAGNEPVCITATTRRPSTSVRWSGSAAVAQAEAKRRRPRRARRP